MASSIRERISKVGSLFFLTVLLPTFVSVVYFGVIASDVYISVSKFVVRSPDKPSASGLGIILKTAGFSNASDEIFAIQSYVVSRDALRTLDGKGSFRKAYSRPSISWFNRFNPTGFFGSFEHLYAYYTSKVSDEFDSTSSISTLTVNAYSPEDAHRINEELLAMAEATVNRLNVRGRADLVQFASTEVADAKKQAQLSALAVSRFRNASGIIDPEKQAAIQLQMISKLQDQLIATQTRVAELRSYAPRNTQIAALETTAQTLRDEIARATGEVAGNTRSLSAKAAEYQRLTLENQVADKQLAAALASLEEARNEARRKQAYVERIVQPNSPDSALEPHRVRGVLTTFLLGLVAWAILSMLIAGVREHND